VDAPPPGATQKAKEPMETLVFIAHNLPVIGERTLEHISIVAVAVGIAILTGVPLGIAITKASAPPTPCCTWDRS
jgi:ABC-type proline/glycine betaine transport system permease subunit